MSTTFDVRLVSLGEHRIQVIRLVRDLTGLGLRESKELVDGLGVVRDGLDRAAAEKVRAKLAAVGATAVVESAGGEASTDGEGLRVHGRVTDAAGEPVAGLLVRAFDRDLRSEERIGETTTAPDGAYRIDYTEQDFVRAEKHRADLEVRVYTETGERLRLSDEAEGRVTFNAGRDQQIDVRLARGAEPSASEWEHLDSLVRPLLDGAEPEELSDEAIDFLAAETEIAEFSDEFPAGAESLRLFASAHRVSSQTRLPASLFYGWGRQRLGTTASLELDLDTLLDAGKAALEDSLGAALEKSIVPTWLADASERLIGAVVELAAARDTAGLVSRRIRGRLIAEEGGRPLGGHRLQVRASDGSVYEVVSDRDGGFSFVHPSIEAQVESFRVQVMEPTGARQLADLELTVEKTSTPVELAVHALGSESIGDITGRLAIAGVPANLASLTTREIRAAGGAAGIEGLTGAVGAEHVRRLDHWVALESLAPAPELRLQLLEAGFESPAAIAAMPRSLFVERHGSALGDITASLHDSARTQGHLLENLHVGLGRLPVGAGALPPQVERLAERLRGLGEERCRCADCESAIGPRAYLIDLLDYVRDHVTVDDGAGRKALDAAGLDELLHRNLASLPDTCEAARDELRQVRIAIEVLRRWLAAPRSDLSVRAAIERADADHVAAAYRELLFRLGIDLERLQAAQSGSERERSAIAGRIGIAIEHVGDLYVPSDELDEDRLEALFGFEPTAAGGPVASATIPRLLDWQRDRLRQIWHEQDWPGNLAGDGQPLIDPDLLGPSDFAPQAAGASPNPAFELWQQRRQGPDGMEVLLRGLRRTPRNLAGLEAVIDAHLATLGEMAALKDRGDQGEDVDSDLARLHLTWAGLVRLTELADALADGPLADAAWEEIFAIVVAVVKGARATTWRGEEHALGITIRPELFEELGTSLEERLASEPWLNWQIDHGQGRSFARTLRSRRQQLANSVEALATVVGEIEAVRLPTLRDALIEISNAPGAALIERAEWLEERLLISMRDSGCRTTTRVAHALETLQSLVFAVRTGALEIEGLDFEIHSDAFDEEWRWLGTYATWKAALSVFLFPETVLLPELRRRQSPVFRDLVERLRQGTASPAGALDAAAEYSEYFSDLTGLTLEACCHTHLQGLEDEGSPDDVSDIPVDVHFFGRGGRSGTLYEAVQRLVDDTTSPDRVPLPIPDEDLSFWTRVPVEEFESVVGAVQFREHLYLFLKIKGDEGEELAYVRRNLRSGEWEAEPTTLELPRAVVRFDAAVEQRVSGFTSSRHNRTFFPAQMAPHLVVLLPGGDLYSLKLDRDVFEWLDIGDVRVLDAPDGDERPDRTDNSTDSEASGTGDWQLLRAGGRGSSKAHALKALHAVVEAGFGFCVLARDGGDRIVYGIFGAGDDGIWRAVGSGAFRGAFYWPRMTSVYVYFGDATQSSYRAINPDRRFGPEREIRGSAALLDWVSRVAGSRPAMRFVNEEPDLDFLREGLEEDSRSGEISRLVDRLVRRLAADPGVDSYAEAVRRAWRGWPVRFRSRDATGELGREQVAGYGLTRLAPVSGLMRERRHLMAWQFSDPAGQGSIGGMPNAGAFRLSLTMDRQGRLTPVTMRLLTPLVETEQTVRLLTTDTDRRARRAAEEAAYRMNAPEPRPVSICVEEAYFHVPMLLAMRLQRSGHYAEALDWYRSVFDYAGPEDERKIYYGLVHEETLRAALERTDDWLQDPLDPHGIAAVRPHAYTRFTLMMIARCLVDFAEAKFAEDTGESLAGARILYGTALEILSLPVMERWESECRRLVLELEGAVDDPEWAPRWRRLLDILGGVERRDVVESAARSLHELLDSSLEVSGVVRAAEDVVAEVLVPLPAATQLERLESARRSRGESAVILLGDSDLAVAAAALTGPFGRRGRGRPLPVGRAAAFSFCVPPNPAIDELRLKVELGLHNLRHCRNLAGMSRPVEPYSVSTEVTLPTITGSGRLEAPQPVSFQPTIYRYDFLVGRAKELVGIAQQLEQSFLSTLERRDAELFGLLQARQGIQLARAAVHLEELRVKEAEDGVDLAELQRDRAGMQEDHYRELLAEPISRREKRGLELLENVLVWHLGSALTQASVAVAQGAAAVLLFATNKEGSFNAAAAAGSAAAGMQSSFAAKASTKSSIELTWASFERRTAEWIFQAQLAGQDTEIGRQQIRLARDRVRVTNQERRIAEMRADYAEAAADFLVNKFTNAELYDWIAGVLEGVYAYFLRQAAAMARLAEVQLAFERQQPIAGTIQPDYWSLESGAFAGADTEPPDRRGLTGSARLLRDLHRLDQYALETDSRKLHISRTLSLARLDPVAFQRFRETGLMVFDTPSALFDRDFPGHYLRLIKRVTASVIALVPPAEGIRAALGTSGLSRVLVGGPSFREVVVRRAPDRVALTAPIHASGVFEFDQEPAKLLPFEGSGVDTRWEFELPRASNPFDFRSIADVLLTLEYTALESRELAHRRIREMDPYQGADRAFSFRHELADAWYDLNNPGHTAVPMTVRFRTGPEDFPRHLDEPEIRQIALYFVRRAGETFEMPIDALSFEPEGGPNLAGGGATTIDGVASTRRGNAASWGQMVGHTPVGEWVLSLPDTREVRDRFEQERLTNILLIIGYEGRRPSWPERS